MNQEKNIIVFDLETQRSADEVGGWSNVHQMGVSVAVTWSSRDKLFTVFKEDAIPELLDELKSADLVVGYNQIEFDYRVLSGYTDFDFRGLKSLDMNQDIRSRLNHRLKLDHIAQATLSQSKSYNYGVDSPREVDGLQALRWWKEGKIDEITAYCRQDVKVTRDLYEYGKKNRCIFFNNKKGQRERLDVDWQ